jgi:hypothetical protein
MNRPYRALVIAVGIMLVTTAPVAGFEAGGVSIDWDGDALDLDALGGDEATAGDSDASAFGIDWDGDTLDLGAFGQQQQQQQQGAGSQQQQQQQGAAGQQQQQQQQSIGGQQQQQQQQQQSGGADPGSDDTGSASEEMPTPTPDPDEPPASDDEESDEPSITFEDQTSDGTSVTVASVSIPPISIEGGFAVVSDGDGTILGVTELREAGPATFENVTVELDDPIEESQTLTATAYDNSNGNGGFDDGDSPYTVDGQNISDTAFVTVEDSGETTRTQPDLRVTYAGPLESDTNRTVTVTITERTGEGDGRVVFEETLELAPGQSAEFDDPIGEAGEYRIDARLRNGTTASRNITVGEGGIAEFAGYSVRIVGDRIDISLVEI